MCPLPDPPPERPFDPAYGYTGEALREIAMTDPEPEDFAPFWLDRAEREHPARKNDAWGWRY